MFFEDVDDVPQFVFAQPVVPFELNGQEPELRFATALFDMHMRWLVIVYVDHEVEAVFTQNSGHDGMIVIVVSESSRECWR